MLLILFKFIVIAYIVLLVVVATFESIRNYRENKKYEKEQKKWK